MCYYYYQARLANQYRSLRPEGPEVHPKAVAICAEIEEEVPVLDTEVSAGKDKEEVLPECGDSTEIGLYKERILEQAMATDTGLPRKPIE
jgi:hypothetical protein